MYFCSYSPQNYYTTPYPTSYAAAPGYNSYMANYYPESKTYETYEQSVPSYKVTYSTPKY